MPGDGQAYRSGFRGRREVITYILIIDDDPSFCGLLATLIKRMGHMVDIAMSGRESRKLALEKAYDVVFLDVKLPDVNGLTMLPEVREWKNNPDVIILTGFGDPQGAEMAIKSGAWDYIQKTSSIESISLSLKRALQYRTKCPPLVTLDRKGIIGDSKQMRACMDLVAMAASSDAGTLVTGPSGTGKELFANAIHANSPRAKGPFIVVDCAALPEELVESILFGYRKGAFTGAIDDRVGLVKRADGGSLFFDEIGEMDMMTQSSLLRVLQEKRFRPIGGTKESTSDFRVISATNRDLDAMVAEGRFRQDLLYRLRAITIQLPPLKERTNDVVDLAVHHTARICRHYDIGIKGLSSDFIDHLRTYDWPGNVRELINVLEISIAASGSDETLIPNHLPDYLRISVIRSAFTEEGLAHVLSEDNSIRISSTVPKWRDFKESGLAVLERAYIIDLMKSVNGDLESAVTVSGLSRARIYQLLKKHSSSRPGDFRKGPLPQYETEDGR